MGGNALLYAKTGRKTAEEFTSIMKDVADRLAKLFPVTKFAQVKSYHQKESFGDGDILLENQFLPTNWIERVRQEFLPDEMYINRLKAPEMRIIKPSVATHLPDLHTGGNYVVPEGPVPCSSVSFDYDGFHIDLIMVQPEDFLIAQVYYAYNDLGNLMGRIADCMGFKYGWNGLVRHVGSGNEIYVKESVSRNPERIFNFLGYDYDRFKRGFETLENMYQFAASSIYFHRSPFQLENRNHRDRIRDEKRSSYTGFVAWLEDKPWLDKHSWVYYGRGEITVPREREKKVWLDHAFHTFPAFKERYDDLIHTRQQAQEAKKVWNGNIVGKLTGLKGRELGDFMARCEVHIETGTPFSFVGWVLHRTPAEIEAFILLQHGQAQS